LSDISQDMQVFKDLINHGLDAVMPAHVVYSQPVQKKNPRQWLIILLPIHSHKTLLALKRALDFLHYNFKCNFPTQNLPNILLKNS
jgi:hypothetical protein